MSKFKLSEWVNDFGRYTERKCIPTEKVKEFIRLLKESAKLKYGLNGFLEDLDKLTGEELFKMTEQIRTIDDVFKDMVKAYTELENKMYELQRMFNKMKKEQEE